MSETITETPPVLAQQTPKPWSLIPFRAAKVVACAVLALLVFISAAWQGLRPMPDPLAPTEAAVAAPPPTAEDVQQLEAYLRQKQVEMAKAKVAAATAPAPALVGPTRTSGTGSRRTAEADEIGETAPRARGGRGDDRYADEMARREYESLFASSTIPATTSRAGAATRPAPPAAPGRARLVADDDPDPVIPSQEEFIKGVLKEMGPSVLAPPALQPVPPVTSPPTAVQTTPAVKAVPSRPAGTFVAYEGTVLDATTINRLDGSAVGPLKALLVNPVYSHDLKLLIPAGAALLGKCQPAEGLSDERIGCGFHRLIMNDGTSVSLDNFTGLSRRGDAGIAAHVNRHYLATFGAAAAVGVISGLGQWVGSGGGYANGDGNNNTTVVLGSVGDATSQAAMQVMSHFLNRRPTLTVKEGTPIKVYLTADLFLPEYREK